LNLNSISFPLVSLAHWRWPALALQDHHENIQSCNFICVCQVSDMDINPTGIDFRSLNSVSLWSLFERKSCYGGALAYAVLSKAKTIGCLCGTSLGKTKADRANQADAWNLFCEKICNILWAKRFAFNVVSHRSSYQGRMSGSWSTDPAAMHQQGVVPSNVNDTVARIASLAVSSSSAELLDQVIYCSKDCRALIIDDLWALLKRDFLCNSSWAPSYKYSFNDEISKINPESACPVDIDIASLRELWSTVLSYLRGIFSGREYARNLDLTTVWLSHLCKSEIPACHRAMTMWVLLLWTSNSTSDCLERAVKLPKSVPKSVSCSAVAACGTVSVFESSSFERRIDAMLMLRNKGMITKAEFEQKRRRILNEI
jgi:hypothetical protein